MVTNALCRAFWIFTAMVLLSLIQMIRMKRSHNWTKTIVSEGVTGFLATTITQSEEVLTKAGKRCKVMEDLDYEGV